MSENAASIPPVVTAPEPVAVQPVTSVSVDENKGLKEPLRLALFALGIGCAFDLLFRGGAVGLGINVLLFTLLLLGTLYFLAGREGRSFHKRTVLSLVTPLLFFAAMLAVRANESLAVYNLIACGVMVLLVWRLGSRDLWSLGIGELLAAPWKALGGMFIAAPEVTHAAIAQVAVEGERKSRALAVLRGVLFALPAVAAFTFLFSSADARFGAAVSGVFTWLFPADFAAQLMRFGGAILVALGCAGGIGYALTRSQTERSLVQMSPRPKPLGFTEAMVVLGSVIALFATFLVMQTTYLFGGNAHVRAVPDLTYAEYARHGFAELNVVAVLTLLLITLLKAVTRRETAGQAHGFSGAGTALLGLTLPLLVSSLVRMQAYEAAYGATELRLYVNLFIGWLAVGLIWCGVMLWHRSVRSGLGLYVCATGFLVSLNVVNPDAVIARRNIERYRHGANLDTGYLVSLSDDAVLEMAALLKDSDADQQRIRERIRKSLEEKEDTKNWAAWNLAHAQAEHIAQQDRLNSSE